MIIVGHIVGIWTGYIQNDHVELERGDCRLGELIDKEKFKERTQSFRV